MESIEKKLTRESIGGPGGEREIWVVPKRLAKEKAGTVIFPGTPLLGRGGNRKKDPGRKRSNLCPNSWGEKSGRTQNGKVCGPDRKKVPSLNNGGTRKRGSRP